MTEPDDDSTRPESGWTGSAPQPQAADQLKPEPVPSTPGETEAGGDGDREVRPESATVPGTGGAPERPTVAALDRSGIPVPGVEGAGAPAAANSAAGESAAEDDRPPVTTTALAPPGKPDGEVDTRI